MGPRPPQGSPASYKGQGAHEGVSTGEPLRPFFLLCGTSEQCRKDPSPHRIPWQHQEGPFSSFPAVCPSFTALFPLFNWYLHCWVKTFCPPSTKKNISLLLTHSSACLSSTSSRHATRFSMTGSIYYFVFAQSPAIRDLLLGNVEVILMKWTGRNDDSIRTQSSALRAMTSCSCHFVWH